MRLLDDRTRALTAAGLFKIVDVMLALALVTNGVVTFFAWIFSPHFTRTTLLVTGLVAAMTLLCWTVLLGYRTCVLIIEARADINLMPEAAARLARMQQIGATPPPKPDKK